MMLVIIFSHNREQMLNSLLIELAGCDIVVIDDGSEFSKDATVRDGFVRTKHNGKRGFWKQWFIAQQIALGSKYDWFLFLPDDISNININAIDEVARQEWGKHLIALNVLEFGDKNRWGNFWTGQKEMMIADVNIRECGYVDGAFLTNRTTLEQIQIEPVPDTWFNHPDKSSGVGHQMTLKLGRLNVPMLVGSFAYHGAHESVMHKEHRKQTPLITL